MKQGWERTTYTQRRHSGFTIVELLIVIVVIGILAAITIVAYNGIQVRSQAAAIVSDLRAAEKAFNSYKIATGASEWWLDSDAALAGTSNSPVGSIITTQPTFREFMQKSLTTRGFNTTNDWFYDNDGDTYNGCSATLNGVNVTILGAPSTELLQAIDKMIDDGNTSCGKLRYSGGYLLYAIAINSAS